LMYHICLLPALAAKPDAWCCDWAARLHQNC
jgi:hypothetical protein